jgi:hypothetical protein
MGKSAKTPKAPNYSKLATQDTAAQKAAWEAATVASRPNQNAPGGSMTWTHDPETGEWTQNVSLDETAQGQYDQLRGLAGTAIGNYRPGFDYQSNMPTVGGYNQQAIDTVRALQAPTLAKNRAAKEAQLAAMGIGTGSGSAWNNEQQNIGVNENQADLEAIMAGIGQGNTEFNQGMQLEQQGFNEAQIRDQMEGAEVKGLMDLSRGVSTPVFNDFTSFGPPGTASQTAAAQNQYQAGLDKANAQNAANSQAWGTVGSIGGAALVY